MQITTYETIAFLLTILVGLLAVYTIGGLLNWYDAGSVFSIATMGVFILRKIDANKTDAAGGSD